MNSSINPELRRNLWLEFSPTRLVLPLLGYLLLYWTIVVGAGEDKLSGAVINASIGIILVVLGLWGARLALGSINEEIRDHTWDLQRMSSLGAWSLTWGKLLGGTSYAWYCASVPMMMFLWYGLASFGSGVFKLALLLLLVGANMQSFSFNVALGAMKRSAGPGRLLGVTIALGSVFLIQAVGYFVAAFMKDPSKYTIVGWWGVEFGVVDFALLSVVLFLLWFLLGAYRLMRNELQFRSIPWAWPAFILFLSLYVAGFRMGGSGNSEFVVDQIFRAKHYTAAPQVFEFWMFLLFSFAILGGIVMLISESKEIVQLRKLISNISETNSFQTNSFHRGLTLIPGWLVSWMLSVVGFLLGVALLVTDRSEILCVQLSVLLLFSRDILIFLFANFGVRSPRRADGMAIVILAFLYLLVPMFLGTVGARDMARWFYPGPDFSLGVITAQIIQVLIFGFLAFRRWSARSKEAS